MSSNFDNVYNWMDDLQPQNLSRYAETAPHQEIDHGSQDYMNLFALPLSGPPIDENILKRIDLISPHCLQRPLSPGTTGEHRPSDPVVSDFNVDSFHHPSVTSLSSSYGNYNILSYSVPYNPPENYLEDRFLSLSEPVVGIGTDHAGNFISCSETQFYPGNHSNSNIYSSLSQPSGVEDNIYDAMAPYSNDAQTSAVLDLSSTLSVMGKPHNEGSAANYNLSDIGTNKHQPKLVYPYSSESLNFGAAFKSDHLSSHSIPTMKYETGNSLTTTVPVTYDTGTIPSSLLNCDFEHANLAFYHSKRSRMDKESTSPSTSYCEVLDQERSKGNKLFCDQPSCPDFSQYFDCNLSTPFHNSPTSSNKMGQDRGTVGIEKDNNSERCHQTFKGMNQNQEPTTKTLEESQQLVDLRRLKKEATTKERKPTKKSERIMRAKAFAQTKKETESNMKPPEKPPKRRRRVVTCKVCSARFAEWSTLKIHLYTHTGDHPFKCNICGEKFAKSSSLSTHQLKHTGEKPHKCSTCGKSFRLISVLKSHMLTHTGEKPFSCDICSSSFTQRAALRRHRNTHLDLRPYTCELCGHVFRDRVYFKKHLLSHELKAKHTCTICGKGFYSNKKLQNHAMLHTEDPNPYKCNKCTSQFVSRKAWRQHKRRTHERNEELRCEDCDATFKLKGAFRAHKKVHTGNNLMKCEICDATFNNLRALKSHIKRHNNTVDSTNKTGSNSEDSNSKGNSSCETNLPPCKKCFKTFSTTRQSRTHRCPKKANQIAPNELEFNMDEDTRGDINFPDKCTSQSPTYISSNYSGLISERERAMIASENKELNSINDFVVHHQDSNENLSNLSMKLDHKYLGTSSLIGDCENQKFIATSISSGGCNT